MFVEHWKACYLMRQPTALEEDKLLCSQLFQLTGHGERK